MLKICRILKFLRIPENIAALSLNLKEWHARNLSTLRSFLSFIACANFKIHNRFWINVPFIPKLKSQNRKHKKVKIHNVQTFLLSWVLFTTHWFIGRDHLGLDQSPSCRICSQSPWKGWRFYIVLYLGLPPFLFLLKVNFCFINKQYIKIVFTEPDVGFHQSWNATRGV